ncbi:MetQ/NlpA family ABC transporter substrate-binding protein [Desulfosporosinus sp. PR]|uniref:MetQ/NlpA family ABC transporter substrate-binding protein n=1 Tax=Candidatus Desulfosporosinus nitrosoreducens TaxID=3401928 RepID=UPI0027E81C33|nr:MetQ/NlpA family ABC transporter substrate-binding protein [Desulfosporosinus sp. PR]MDQ7092000.1 MetQ/NlpA family ABC transporter substrate-binding protein [Desulfosporosinus sp. PR]
MLKKQQRRPFALILISLLSLILVLAGCGQPQAATATTNPTGTTVLKVGATPVPHAEILEFIKPALAKEGIDLKIVNYTDYVRPNLDLDSGEIDANFFQHTPYLESFNQDHHLNLVSLTKVHIEPMGVYSKKITNLDQLKSGATIAIPNDPSNSGRALALLAKAGLIQLKDGAGISGTVKDISSNPKQLNITPIDAPQLPRVLQDPKISAAVINTNYALEAGLNPTKDSLFTEDKDSPYANILVVKDNRKNDPALQKLAKTLTSPDVKKFITDKYKGSIVPAF